MRPWRLCHRTTERLPALSAWGDAGLWSGTRCCLCVDCACMEQPGSMDETVLWFIFKGLWILNRRRHAT